MNFRSEMSRLRSLGAVTRADLAEVMGSSPATIKQALFRPTSPGHRPAPYRWNRALANLARRRAKELEDFASEMESLERVV